MPRTPSIISEGMSALIIALARAGYLGRKQRQFPQMSSVSRRQRLTITVRDSQARPAPTLVEPNFTAAAPKSFFPRVTAI